MNQQKLSIAIQFYGHCRSFRQTFNNFKKNILDINKDVDIDVYIHMWDELEHTASRKQYIKDLAFAGKPVSKNDIDFIVKNYNPTDYQIDSQLLLTTKDCDEIIKNGYTPQDFEATYNVSYSMRQVNNLRKKTGKKYDFVILTRLDIDFLRPLVLTKLLQKNIDPQVVFSQEELKQTVFYPYMETPDLIRNQNNYITGIDLFSITSTNIMDKIGDWHNNVLALSPKGIEGSITRIIKENNFNYQLLYYKKPDCWTIQRTNANDIQLSQYKVSWNFVGLRKKYEEYIKLNDIYLFDYLKFLMDTGQIDICYKTIDFYSIEKINYLLQSKGDVNINKTIKHIIHLLYQEFKNESDGNINNKLMKLILSEDNINLNLFFIKNMKIFKVDNGKTQMIINFAMNTLFKNKMVDDELIVNSLFLYTQESTINVVRKKNYLSMVIDYCISNNIRLETSIVKNIEIALKKYQNDTGSQVYLKKLAGMPHTF